MLSLLRSSNRA